jgi:hypothetical protein
VKPLKQALVTELTAALASHLPTTPAGALPKPVAQAVEDLADRILRWQACQQRSPRISAGKSTPSESDALTRLMDSRLHEEEDLPEPDLPLLPTPASSPEQPTTARTRRPRLAR